MATARIEIQKITILTLTEKEADWLAAISQNFLPFSDAPEPPEDTLSRESIFQALKPPQKDHK